MECGHKAPGQYRIVMMGSSYGFGLWVPRERSFAATLPTELSRLTGKRIELYNVSMQWGFPANFVLRFHEILAANPDIILWDLTPADVEYATLVLPLQDPPRPSYISRVRSRFADNSLPDAVAMLLNSGWSAAVRSLLGPGIIPIEHVLYSSRTQYVESALTKPDSEVGFLKAQPSPAWREHLQEFDREAATIEAQANEAGIPFVAVLIPDRAQAAMISTREWPIGYDPYKLDDELRSIVVSHAGIYVDILPDFRETANPEQHYFPVDGHPDAAGQAMISAMLAAALSRGAVPALSVAAKQQIAQEQGN
jgi:hypothetical protein